MNKTNKHKEDWLFEITPKNNLFSFNFKEIWQYRDLLMLFVKRDVITIYKQTILGPLWYLIQPLFTSVIFTLVFNNVAGIQTGEIPPFLFNLAGITIWNYFKDCLIATSDTFKKNEQIFGKVYFPRIIMPLSIIVSNLIKFGIQMGIFIGFYIFYSLEGANIQLDVTLFFFPILVLMMGLLGLGLGMIISSMVTKYRDLTFLVSFGVQLLMYISLVIFPLSLFQQKGLDWLVKYNPMAHIIDTARYMFTGTGSFNIIYICYTIGITIVVFLLGILIFNKTEKNFIDTI